MPQEEDQSLVTKGPRIFVGLKIAPLIAKELAEYAHRLERAPSRFVRCDDVHLTLVPPWNESSIPEVIEKLRVTSRRLAPFPLTFTRLAYWPNHRRPRLLCVECTPSDVLAELQSTLLNVFGQTNARPSRPHVTLARLKRGAKAASAKSALDEKLTLEQSIGTVELFQSPTPPVKGYALLASVPLAAHHSKSAERTASEMGRHHIQDQEASKC